MKKVFSLFLCLACFLSVGMLGGCSETDLSGVQSQIDELNATISALEDRLSAAEGNNTELQDQLNQATAKLATLEGKINGEPIKYLNEGEKATFVNNGIKLFDIWVMKGKYTNSDDYIDFNFNSYSDIQNPNDAPFHINSFLYDSSTKSLRKAAAFYVNSNIDQIHYFGKYQFRHSEHTNTAYTVFLFSGTNFVVAYNLEFIPFPPS